MSRDKMLDMNQKVMDNTTAIKRINRIAEETTETSTNILRTLGGQRDQIGRQIEMHKQINNELGKVNATTNEMTRRALCIKCALYVAILVLFGLLIVALIVRINRSSSTNDKK